MSRPTRTGRPPRHPLAGCTVTQREIARVCGMKQSTISRLLNGEKVCIRIADVGAIAAAVGMEPNDLVRALAENPAINP